MSDQKKTPQYWHEQFLAATMQWRSSHPDFTCSLRKIDRNGRLSDGYWFHGNQDYVFIGLFKPNDNKNHTPTVGFVIILDENDAEAKKVKLQIAFPDEKNQKDGAIYRAMVTASGGAAQLDKVDYSITLPGADPVEVFKRFLENVYPKFLNILSEHDAKQKFLVPEDEFTKALLRINKVKLSKASHVTPAVPQAPALGGTVKMADPINVIFYGPPGTGKTRNILALIKGEKDEMSETFKEKWNHAEYVDDSDEELSLDEILLDATWFSVIFSVLVENGAPLRVSEIAAIVMLPD